MSKLVPNRTLFDFEFPLARRAKTPSITGALTDWSDDYLLPYLGQLDGEEPFGTLWACWNESGLSIACRVQGKSRPLRCDPKTFWKGDNLRLCIDTRDTRNIKRASKHCQQFFLLPTGGGKSSRKPVAASTPIQRARESAPAVPPGVINVAANVAATGYQLEAHLPAAALSGFEPAEHPRIGFFYILEDLQFGQQYLTVGDDLYWHVDPSTWPTAVLQR